MKIESNAFFICDVQEKLVGGIACVEHTLHTIKKLLKFAELMKIPFVVTEQYPKGLGHTIPELDVNRAALVHEKTQFSGATPEIIDSLRKLNIQHVLICGYETHICIQQTVQDLLDQKFKVSVIVDGTSSRNLLERSIAFKAMSQEGARLTSMESIFFQMLQSKNHSAFKEVSALVKDAWTGQSLPYNF